jgi:hypothetical protein
VAPTLLSTDVADGSTLHGTVDWTVRTAGDVTSVEFWADGRRLGSDSSPPWRFDLRTAALGDGQHDLGLALLGAAGRRVSETVGQVVVANAAAVPPAGRPDAPVDETVDWETGDTSQVSGLECPSQAADFSIVQSPVRQGRYAAHFHLDSSSEPWSNGWPRCLSTLYDSGETAGDDEWYGFSLYTPAPFGGLVWELHQPQSLYSLRGCGLAPLALFAEEASGESGLYFRLATGDCVNGGWSHQDLNIPLRNLDPVPTGTWVDVVVHVRFSESDDGLVQVWDRYGGRPYAIDLERTGVPTTQYCSSCGIHDVRLYQEAGLYAPPLQPGDRADVYLDAFRRGQSFAAVAP